VDEALELEEIRDYNPDRLLDVLREKFRLRNDAALSRMLEVAPTIISKVRHRKLPVGASLLIRMHEVFGLNITDLRFLMGDRRNKFRVQKWTRLPLRPSRPRR
jgi:hypothetical protein